LRVLFLAVLCAAMIGAGSTRAAEFSAYPAPVYNGPVTQPGFKGPQRDYATYRTRIRASVANGAQFAGHYALAVVGCGTSCRFGFITDLKTGIVSDLPHGGEDYYGILYRARPDSRLLQTQWRLLDEEYAFVGCALEDFVWTGKAFRSLGVRRAAGDCPDWDDYAD
jgi:hypothetical protein